MSKTIDERVVSMQFDNKNFESNVKTTMGTLQRLKQSLNLSGASKGLENVGAAARKVDFNPMASGVESVRLKFSALEVMAVTALSRITNSAITAGKNLVTAFTIAPVKSGFQEYETQINAIQTILSNTKSKGSTLDDVNRTLDELNTYADKTIYNFTEMTRNIGTFTAAGIGLEDSAKSIQGIANLAAMSGSNAQQASTAMYQLSQAMASGTVKLMDWNSVVNAGMGGQLFQDALKETARMHGVAVDEMIEKQGSFRESLSEGWITADILTETLSKMTQSGAAEYLSDLTGITQEEIAATQKLVDENKDGTASYEELAQKMAETGALTKEQAINILEMADEATNAATKVKTFTQLMDTLKEAVQSGWTQTWEYIIGDFNEAKELFTGISDFFSGIIGKSADSRNAVLFESMTSGYKKLVIAINEAGLSTGEFLERVEDSVRRHGGSVESLIKNYGSLEKAIKAGAVGSSILKEALNGVSESMADLSLIKDDLKIGETGDDIKQAQAALKELGYELGKFGEQADGIDGIFGSVTQSAVKAFQAANNLKVTGIVDEATLAALKETTTTTEELKGNFDDLIDSVTTLGGREMLIESFKNALVGIRNVLLPIKSAWKEVFPPKSVEEQAEKLNGVIAKIHEFSKSLTKGLKFETVNNLRRTFEGLFSVLDIISKITSGTLGLGFRILGKVLSSFNLNILDVTAAIGDAITAFDEMILRNKSITEVVNAMAASIVYVVDAIKWWAGAFKDLMDRAGYLDQIVTKFSNFKTEITDWYTRLQDIFTNFWSDIFGSADEKITADGILDALETLWRDLDEHLNKLGEVLRKPLSAIKTVVVGVVADLVSYLNNTFGDGNGSLEHFIETFEQVESVVNMAIEPISNFISKLREWGGMFREWVISLRDSENLSADIAAGIVDAVFILAGALKDVAMWIGEGLFDGFRGVSTNIVSGLVIGLIDGIQIVGGIIAQLASALIAKACEVLGIHSPSSVFLGIGLMCIAGLAIGISQGAPELWSAIVNVLSTIVGKFSEYLKGISFDKMLSLAAFGGVIYFVKKISDAFQTVAGVFDGLGDILTGVGKVLRGFSKVLNGFARNLNANAFKKYSRALLDLAIAIGILAASVAGLAIIKDKYDIWGAVKAIAALSGVLAGLALVYGLATKLAKGNLPDFGKMGLSMIAMSVTLLLIASAAKKLDDITNAGQVFWTLAGMLVAIGAVIVTYGALAKGKNTKSIDKLGPMLLKMGAAMLLMAYVAKVMGNIPKENFVQAIEGIGALGVLIAGLIFITKFSGSKVNSIGAMFGKLALAVGAFALVAKMFGDMDWSEYSKAEAGIKLIGNTVSSLVAVMLVLSGISNLMGGGDLKSVGTAILQVAGSMAIMAVAAKIFATMEWGELGKAGASIAALAGGIGLFIFFLSKIEVKKLDGVGSTVLAVSGSILVLAAAAKIFATMEWGELGKAGAAIGALGIGIGFLIKFLSGVETKKLTGITSTMLIVSGAIVMLSVIAAGIGLLPLPVLAKGVVAVGILGLIIAGIIKSTANAKDAKANIIAATAAIVLMAAAVAALTLIPDPWSLATAVAAIAALAAILVYVNNQFSANSGKSNIKSLLTMTGVIAVLSTALYMLGQLQPGNALAAAGSIAIVLLTLSGALAILNMTGANSAEVSLNALGGMLASIVVIGIILKYLEGIDPASALASAVALGVTLSALAIAMAIVSKFGTGGGGMVGSLLAMSVALVAVGVALKMISSIPTESLGPVFLTFAGAIVVVTVALITLAAAFTYLAPGAALLSGVLLSFSVTVLAVTIGALGFAAALYIVGLALPSIGAGLTTVGAGLTSLGEGITNFIVAVAGASTSIVEFTNVMRTLGLSVLSFLAQLAAGLVLAGGGAVVAGVGLAVMAAGLGLVSLAGIMTAGAIMVLSSAFIFAANAMTIMANAASFLGTCISDGLAAGIASGIEKVTGAVAGLANGIIGTICSILGINSPSLVMQMLGQYTGQGFALGLTDSQGEVGSAASMLANVASEGLGGAGEEGGKEFNLEALQNMDIASLMSGEGFDSGSLTALFGNTGAAGGKEFNLEALQNMDFDLLTSGSGFDMSAITNMFGDAGVAGGEAFSNGANENVSMQPTMDGMLDEITGSKSRFTKAGSEVTVALIKGIEQKRSAAHNTALSLATLALNAVRSKNSNFYSAGSSLVSGFVSGISANTFRASAAASAMASAALSAAKSVLAINSPSKVFREIGKGVPEGFAQGIGMLGGAIKKSVIGMSNGAIDGTRNAIASIADAINSDVDSQPTIRPVLDLSDIRAGAGSINSLFRMQPSVGVMSNVGAISTMMNRNRQNGANSDVISAIKDLGKNIANSPTTNYNMNGITYNDGSDVSEALKVLVRAARVERRV